ncbi:hypothetical protein [Bradyrhizobium ottawaense]|uniref:hypothetical protein n=1 Tax=Bradyrhizobium ottawaense TaxID=931866 RepID=UPI0038396243
MIVDELVDRYFEDFAAKTMTAELREMQRLGISTMNIAQFRKAVHEGRPPSERPYALKNPDWLFGLAREGREGSGVRSIARQIQRRACKNGGYSRSGHLAPYPEWLTYGREPDVRSSAIAAPDLARLPRSPG